MSKEQKEEIRRTYSCSVKGCGGSIIAYPPDDLHTIASLKPPKEGEDAITRSYPCNLTASQSNPHETTLYWYAEARPIARVG